MSQLLSVLDINYLPQNPPPLIPNPPPGQLPGELGNDVNAVVGALKGGLLVVAVVVGLIGSGLIMAGSKNRSGYAVSGIEKIGMVLLGVAAMGSLPSILGLVV